MVERDEEEETIDESAQENFAVAMNPVVVNRLLHDDNDFSQIEVINDDDDIMRFFLYLI